MPFDDLRIQQEEESLPLIFWQELRQRETMDSVPYSPFNSPFPLIKELFSPFLLGTCMWLIMSCALYYVCQHGWTLPTR